MGEADAEGVAEGDRHTDAGEEAERGAEAAGERAEGRGGAERSVLTPGAWANSQDTIPALQTCTRAKSRTRAGQVPLGQGHSSPEGGAAPSLSTSALEALGSAQP